MSMFNTHSPLNYWNVPHTASYYMPYNPLQNPQENGLLFGMPSVMQQHSNLYESWNNQQYSSNVGYGNQNNSNERLESGNPAQQLIFQLVEILANQEGVTNNQNGSCTGSNCGAKCGSNTQKQSGSGSQSKCGTSGSKCGSGAQSKCGASGSKCGSSAQSQCGSKCGSNAQPPTPFNAQFNPSSNFFFDQ